MTEAEQKLKGYRAQIDALDEAIAKLLVERTGVIHEVAALKAQHWPGSCHIRPGREGQMHQALTKRFAGTDFPPLAALAIWRQLIGASTHLESPLNVAYLAAHADHGWLAREYFGVQVGQYAAATLADALAAIQSGRSNLLILPAPRDGDWWHDAKAIHDAGLSIFARLPVAEHNVPGHAQPAIALAAVTPEDSGDDVSYFLEDGKCVTVNGFETTRKHAIFLGAHPRPIAIGA